MNSVHKLHFAPYRRASRCIMQYMDHPSHQPIRPDHNNIHYISSLNHLAPNLIYCYSGGIMRVAVPEHQGRIAPVFDCCRRILIVVQNAFDEEVVTEEDWSTLPRLGRAPRLNELVVQCILCGGISCWMEDQIRKQGVQIIPWVCGDVWEALKALRNGMIHDPRYAMPGRGACRRRRLGLARQQRLLEETSNQKGAHRCLDLTERDH
jgi:hypothetical protein